METIIKCNIPIEIVINDEILDDTIYDAVYNYIDQHCLPENVCIEDLPIETQEKVFHDVHIILKNRWGF